MVWEPVVVVVVHGVEESVELLLPVEELLPVLEESLSESVAAARARVRSGRSGCRVGAVYSISRICSYVLKVVYNRMHAARWWSRGRSVRSARKCCGGVVGEGGATCGMAAAHACPMTGQLAKCSMQSLWCLPQKRQALERSW